jgi:hypothetical protein
MRRDLLDTYDHDHDEAERRERPNLLIADSRYIHHGPAPSIPTTAGYRHCITTFIRPRFAKRGGWQTPLDGTSSNE